MFTIQNSERLELTATLVKEALYRLKLVSNESGLLWQTEGGSKLVPGQKIPFWASFLNYTGSAKRTANLADVFIPKGETNKTSNYLKGKSNKMSYIKMSSKVKCYQILWEIPETVSFR